MYLPSFILEREHPYTVSIRRHRVEGGEMTKDVLKLQKVVMVWNMFAGSPAMRLHRSALCITRRGGIQQGHTKVPCGHCILP